jgi:hypothetical protein
LFIERTYWTYDYLRNMIKKRSHSFNSHTCVTHTYDTGTAINNRRSQNLQHNRIHGQSLIHPLFTNHRRFVNQYHFNNQDLVGYQYLFDYQYLFSN